MRHARRGHIDCLDPPPQYNAIDRRGAVTYNLAMVAGVQIGAYRLLQQIGEGGMGVVWLAEHVMLGRRAAIKVLHPSFSSQPEIVTRFFNEARAATAISDPGIVQIFDFGHHSDGSAYIVMELLDGEPLDKRLQTQGAMPVGEALRILRQVASSLGAAHARGIVHRDLKPENIFLVRDPEVAGGTRAKILDFGIAKLTGDASMSKTNTSAVMGTPAYMSPEQCKGAGLVDARSDIYALGCVLMVLLTGRPPFEAEGFGELLVMHLREPPPAPSSRVPTVPPLVDQLVLRCLAKDPAQRYANGTDLASAVGTLVTQPALDTAPHITAPGPVAAMQPTTLSGSAAQLGSSMGTTMPTRARGNAPLLLAGVGVVVAASVAVVLVLQSSNKNESVSASEGASTPESREPDTTAATADSVTPVQPQPTPPAPSPADDPATKTKAAIAEAVTAFTTWAKANAGAPCPKLDDVAGRAINDAWGHPLSLTCTDQPSDQIVGVVSPGPDATLGTRDDIASWHLERAITDTLRGARWRVTVADAPADKSDDKSKPKPASKAKRTAKPKQTETGAAGDLDGDGIPDTR